MNYDAIYRKFKEIRGISDQIYNLPIIYQLYTLW